MDGDAPLDLSRPRDVPELLGTTMSLFGRHSGLFFTVTLLVVAPIYFLVDGLWGGALRDGADADPSPWADLASTLLGILVIPAFVTALHCVIVRDLSRAAVPSPAAALAESAPRLLAATGTVALYTLAIAAGFIALFIPGIWLSVRLYFGAQSAVLDQTSPTEALSRSAKLVEGRWWWTFGALILSIVAFSVPGAIVHQAIAQIDSPAVYVVLTLIVRTFVLSLTALFGTLLFFTLRVR